MAILRAPTGIKRAVVGGAVYPVDGDGYINVPDHLIDELVAAGFVLTTNEATEIDPTSGANYDEVFVYASGNNVADATRTVTEKRIIGVSIYARDIEYNSTGQLLKINRWTKL